MGQKVNAIGFRLGLNKHWNSHWHAPMSSNEHGYIHILKEDFKINHYIKSTLRDSSVMGHLQSIQRKSGHLQLFLKMNQIKIKSSKKKKKLDAPYEHVLKQVQDSQPQWLKIKYDDDITYNKNILIPSSFSCMTPFKSHPISFKWRRFFHDAHMQNYIHEKIIKHVNSNKIQTMMDTLNLLKPKMEYIEHELDFFHNTEMNMFMNKSSIYSYDQFKAKLFLCTYLYDSCISFNTTWEHYKTFRKSQYDLFKKQLTSFKDHKTLHMTIKKMKKDLKNFKYKFKGLYDSWKWFQYAWKSFNDLTPSTVLLNSFKFYKFKILKYKLYKYINILKSLHVLKEQSLKKLENISSCDPEFLNTFINSNESSDYDLKPMKQIISNMMKTSKKKKIMMNEELLNSHVSSLFQTFVTYHSLHSHVFHSLKSLISKIYWLKFKLYDNKHDLKQIHMHENILGTTYGHIMNMKSFKKRIHKYYDFHRTSLAFHKKNMMHTEKIFGQWFNPVILRSKYFNKKMDLPLRRIKKRLRDSSKMKFIKRKRTPLISLGLNFVWSKMKSILQLMIPSHIRMILKPSRKKYDIPYNIHYLTHNVTTTLGTSKYKRKFPFLFRDLSDKFSYVMAVLKERKHRARKIRGFRMQYAGKLWSKGRAKKQVLGHGTISLQNISQWIHYEFVHQTTKYGVTGFKLWLNYYPLTHKVASSVSYNAYAHLYDQKHQLRSLRLFLIHIKEKLKKKILLLTR